MNTKNCSKIIKTFPKNPLNSKNYSVSKLTAFCEIFTPGTQISQATVIKPLSSVFISEAYVEFTVIKSSFEYGI